MQEMNTLFVGDLSIFCEENDIQEMFHKYGELEEVKIIRCEETNKNLSYGFVKYTTNEAAVLALKELNGVLLVGRPMRIGWAARKPNLIEANNLPSFEHTIKDRSSIHIFYQTNQVEPIINEAYLLERFGKLGEILDISIKRFELNQEHQYQKGYGFVHFPFTNDGLESALKCCQVFNDQMIDNVAYKCNISHRLKKSMDPNHDVNTVTPLAAPYKHHNQAVGVYDNEGSGHYYNDPSNLMASQCTNGYPNPFYNYMMSTCTLTPPIPMPYPTATNCMPPYYISSPMMFPPPACYHNNHAYGNFGLQPNVMNLPTTTISPLQVGLGYTNPASAQQQTTQQIVYNQAMYAMMQQMNYPTQQPLTPYPDTNSQQQQQQHVNIVSQENGSPTTYWDQQQQINAYNTMYNNNLAMYNNQNLADSNNNPINSNNFIEFPHLMMQYNHHGSTNANEGYIVEDNVQQNNYQTAYIKQEQQQQLRNKPSYERKYKKQSYNNYNQNDRKHNNRSMHSPNQSNKPMVSPSSEDLNHQQSPQNNQCDVGAVTSVRSLDENNSSISSEENNSTDSEIGSSSSNNNLQRFFDQEIIEDLSYNQNSQQGNIDEDEIETIQMLKSNHKVHVTIFEKLNKLQLDDDCDEMIESTSLLHMNDNNDTPLLNTTSTYMDDVVYK